MNKLFNAKGADRPISQTGMKSFRLVARSGLILFTISALLAAPTAGAVRAQSGSSIIASAIIVPEQVSELGFLTTALLSEVPVEKGDVVEAGQILAALEATDVEYRLAAAEAAYRSAQSYAELQRYRTVKKYDRRGRPYFEYMPREVFVRADALAEAAYASLEVAQIDLAQYTLLSPYGGTVAAVHARPGELVQLDQPVITLATLDRMQIETTDLGERDIPKIKIGQRATIYIEALDAEFTARVSAIAPRADLRGGDVTYKVSLVFDKQPDGLLWGMTAEVTITVE